MTDSITIQLLGGFQITAAAEAVSGFSNSRLQSVLAYLILNRNAPQSRQQLAYLFWPDSTDSQARTNLRNILHLLRNTLPNATAAVTIDTSTVHWRPDGLHTVDIVQFDEAVAVAQSATDEMARRSALEQAVNLYTGDLLPACYDDWILSVREEWQQRYLNTVEQLIDLLERQREYRTALDHAQRLLQYDPLLETTYGRLMQLHAALGDRAAALRVYHLCRTTLDRELGVEPSPTTQAIYERLLNLETPVAPTETLRLATPLVGRDGAWAALQQQWQRLLQGSPRQSRVEITMINGEAGIGKTRLAEEFSEALR
ncbi:MAG: AAA family ATPase, partial [Caldilineaceae bacterium]|nr:AAA family ATPase [Caldilineaceae bacterium]